MAFATIVRSPKSCDTSFTYGVSPHPEQAPENSNSGSRNCAPFTESTFTVVRSASGRSRKKSKFACSGLADRRLRGHVDGLQPHFALVLRRTDVHAQLAAGAIFRCHLHGVLHALVLRPLVVHALERGRRLGKQRRIIDLRADRGVRTDHRALVALDAGDRIPHRDLERDVALLPLRRARRERTVHRHRAHRQVVAEAGDDLCGDVS